ncbi:MAG TPA: NAD(P)-dependent oxidoreductase [Myxococcales bacterium]|jgi:nucleoside-diphosphate-sugar epimerase
MPLHVLVTGAYGNIGRHVLRELLARGHRVRAFDLASPAARRDAARIPGAESCWGDLRQKADVVRAVEGVDAVVHLAFVLPPRTETDPEGTHAVNVQGSLNLFEALQEKRPQALLALASSYALYGDTRRLEGLVTPETPVSLVSNYNRHKAEVEERLRASGLVWTILRLGVVLSAESAFRTKLDPTLIFDLPADCKQEFVHCDDVATAFARCLEVQEAWGKVLLIGGGKTGQLRYLDFLNRTLGSLGVAPLPAEAFSLEARQGGGWMDTSESERLLGFQHWTFERHLEDLAQKAGIRRTLAKVFSPLVRAWLVRASPHRRPAPAESRA